MQIREHTSGQGGANKPAIILHPSGTVISFDELEARANRLAHYFRQAGLVEGDAVAILMENNEHIHAVMWAARRSGLYYVPINTHLTGGCLHHRQQRRQGDHRIGRVAQNMREPRRTGGTSRLRGTTRRPAGSADDCGRRSRRLAALPGLRCRSA